MKHTSTLRFLLAAVCAVFCFAESAKAQIELIFEGNQTGSYNGLVLIDHDTPRYLDHYTSGFSLYHLDFSLDVSVTYPELPAIGVWKPLLISRSLFDCDSNNLEYAVTQTNSTNGGQFRVFGADGSTLLSVDSFAMSQAFLSIEELQPRAFLSDSSGTYLMLRSGYNPFSAPAQRIYKVCGQLPQSSMRNAQGAILGGRPAGKNPISGFKLYPNPARDEVRIEYDLQGHSRGRLEVFNTQGVRVKEVQLGPAFNFVLLNVSALSPGTYVARISSEDGWQLSEKMVKLE